jgi:hypothetical protein
MYEFLGFEIIFADIFFVVGDPVLHFLGKPCEDSYML